MKSWIAIVLSAILIFCTCAFTVREAVVNMMPGQNGAEVLFNLTKVLKNFNDNRISSNQTQDCSRFLTNALEDFQFQKVYDSNYMARGAKGYKGISFHGYNQDNGYVFDITSQHSTSPNLNTKGSLVADLGFKRHYRSVVGDPSFSTYINASTNTGRLSHITVNKLIDDILKVLDPANLKRSQNKDVVSQLMDEFPNSAKFFGHFMDLQVDCQIREDQGKEFTCVTIKSALHLNKLNDDYPWTAAHLDNLEGAVRTNMRFVNEFGHQVLQTDFQTEENFLNLTFCTRNGKMVPTDGFGKPQFKEEFSLSNLSVYPVDILMDLYTKANGLKFSTKGIRILVDYEKLDQGMLLSIRSDNLVDTHVSGMALHVFPTWSVDWLLPSSMEELIYDFSTVIVQANEGEGSFVKLMCNTMDAENTKTQVYASTEVLDNFFVRFGAKMASDYFGMGPITAKEAKGLRSKALEVIMKDFENLARHNVAGYPEAIPQA